MIIAQISSKYGVHPTQIHRWCKEAMEWVVSGSKSKSKIKDASQEEMIKQLYEQIGQLTVEEWLKKLISLATDKKA